MYLRDMSIGRKCGEMIHPWNYKMLLWIYICNKEQNCPMICFCNCIYYKIDLWQVAICIHKTSQSVENVKRWFFHEIFPWKFFTKDKNVPQDACWNYIYYKINLWQIVVRIYETSQSGANVGRRFIHGTIKCSHGNL